MTYVVVREQKIKIKFGLAVGFIELFTVGIAFILVCIDE